MSEEANKIRDLNQGTGGRALVDVELTLNDVKRVVAEHIEFMFANLKPQPAIVVGGKAIFVQYARPDCWKLLLKEGPTIPGI